MEILSHYAPNLFHQNNLKQFAEHSLVYHHSRRRSISNIGISGNYLLCRRGGVLGSNITSIQAATTSTMQKINALLSASR